MIRVALSTTSKKSYNSRPNEPSGLAFFHTRNSHRLLLQYDTALSIYKDTSFQEKTTRSCVQRSTQYTPRRFSVQPFAQSHIPIIDTHSLHQTLGLVNNTTSMFEWTPSSGPFRSKLSICSSDLDLNSRLWKTKGLRIGIVQLAHQTQSPFL